MTPPQLKEQLNALLDTLSPDQAELVLDFATLLTQRQVNSKTQKRWPDMETVAAWESALAVAEIYWFQLPESVRQRYLGQTVALLRDRILDSDIELHDLRLRMAAQYLNQPILYLDADAEQEPILLLRSPRLR
jgi:hypothetical protein